MLVWVYLFLFLHCVCTALNCSSIIFITILHYFTLEFLDLCHKSFKALQPDLLGRGYSALTWITTAHSKRGSLQGQLALPDKPGETFMDFWPLGRPIRICPTGSGPVAVAVALMVLQKMRWMLAVPHRPEAGGYSECFNQCFGANLSDYHANNILKQSHSATGPFLQQCYVT